MKTKALLSVALALPPLCGASPSALTVPDGEYRLVAACRLQSPETPLIGQLPGMELFVFSSVADMFFAASWSLGQWGPGITFSAGEGAVFQPSGGDVTLLFQQSVAPKLPLQLEPGFHLICCQTDIVSTFEDIVGTPPANGTLLYQFNAGPGRKPFNLASPDYTIFTFANGAWSPTNPVVGVTEAVFVYQPPQLSNAEVIANGISFEITPPLNQQFLIEYTDSLTQPSWQPLTNVLGSGASIKVTDDSMGTSVKQRFYRARSTQ